MIILDNRIIIMISGKNISDNTNHLYIMNVHHFNTGENEEIDISSFRLLNPFGKNKFSTIAEVTENLCNVKIECKINPTFNSVIDFLALSDLQILDTLTPFVIYFNNSFVRIAVNSKNKLISEVEHLLFRHGFGK